MTTLSEGKVPAFYREVFDACSFNGDPIHRDVFKELLETCALEPSTLKIIWDLTGPQQGLISRTNLYKALALIGWAKEGKTPSDKLFDNFTKEYPIPELGDLTLITNMKNQLNLQSNPAVLGLSYADIKQLDSIKVELVPEKKGLIIKYSEYIVNSRRYNCNVTRRYNDFVALHELLLGRFPYRIIPRLPPKKIVSDSRFLESRRRGLQRWLTLVCRHPTVCHDAIVSFFLTDQGPDIQYRIRDIFRKAPDEFMTSDIAASAKNFLPSDCSEFASNREQVRLLVQIISRLKQLTDAGVERMQARVRDSEDLSNQLRALGNVNPENLSTRHWKQMQYGFTALAEKFLPISIKINSHASVEQIAVCDRLDLLLEILMAHRDLCERLERGLAHDHQAALAKMLSLKKRKIQGVIKGTNNESVEKLEAKVLEQESIISNMELRSDFSLYCVHMETELVHTYLETLSVILGNYVAHRSRAHNELALIWQDISPVVEQHFNSVSEKSQTNGSK